MACIVLATVLLWAAIPKLLDPGTFMTDVQNYRLVPAEWVAWFALFLPVFELMLALGLLTKATRRGAALLAALLLAAFAFAMAQARFRGIDLRCGCFGAELEAKVSWLTVARSSGLSLLALFVLVQSAPKGARVELSDEARTDR
jgi:hypothetical protein